MKKVLLISYYFPPQPEAGALRPGYLAKYLPAFGWEATVVTRRYISDPEHSGRVAAVGPRVAPMRGQSAHREVRRQRPALLRSLAGLVRSILIFPDSTMTWFPAALRKALQITQAERFDALITTHGPATEHLLGTTIARVRHLPWLADYRDLWYGNPYLPRGPLRKRLEWFTERVSLLRAAKITTVAPGLVGPLQTALGRKDIEVIPNGADLAVWDAIPEKAPSSFMIFHAGRTYGGDRTPQLLFEAVASLRAEGNPAGYATSFNFYGPDSQFIVDLAQQYSLGDAVAVMGMADRRTILQAERTAAVLLVLIGFTDAAASYPGSKFFEYIGAKRPILGIGPSNSALKQVIEESNVGAFASTVEDCKQFIATAFKRFSQGFYEPQTSISWRPWTAEDMARSFARELDALIDGH